jgi:hypothetical protein
VGRREDAASRLASFVRRNSGQKAQRKIEMEGKT